MKKIGCLTCTEAEIGRRDFLRVGSVGALGLSLSQVLEWESLLAGPAAPAARAGKAEACIMLWLGGGPSQMDTWDPKSNSGFKPIATNIDGIRISEILPLTARHMDKLSIIRSMHTEENNHPQGHHYVLTGHSPNAADKFPSFPSIITKELGPRGEVPPHVLCPGWDSADAKRYNDLFRSAFMGAAYDPMILADRGEKGIDVTDLVLPQSFPVESLENRSSFLKIVDRHYRQQVELAEFSNMDGFREQALQMILSPQVREAFDLSRESDKMKEAYGKHKFGQSVLLARRLVEAGSRFVTANGYSHNVWDTHGDNDAKHRGRVGASPGSGAFDPDGGPAPERPPGDDRGPGDGRVRPDAPPESEQRNATTGPNAGRWPSVAEASVEVKWSAPATNAAGTWPSAWSPWETCTPPSTRPWGSIGTRN